MTVENDNIFYYFMHFYRKYFISNK